MRDGMVLSEAAETGGYRVTNAFALIEQVLAQAQLAREAVEVIAVGLGPGSYTGIRAAIAVAQGWQLATGVKVLGISSADSLAAEAQRLQIFGRVHGVIDAQRGEYYLATWEISAKGCTIIAPLTIMPSNEIITRQSAGECCVGPEMPTPLFPSASAVARLAGGRNDFVAGEMLEPIYLRETAFVKAPPARTF